MNRVWPIIGVRDVQASSQWYQSILGCANSHTSTTFDQIVDADGTVLVCLHHWGEHEHPTLMSADSATPGNGLILLFRVDDFEAAVERARALVERFEEEPRQNPNTGTMQFSVRDPDGYYVMINSAV
jgi:catechol 2,3-dioxygenase-like lactoylglutathione lyase family enzyme